MRISTFWVNSGVIADAFGSQTLDVGVVLDEPCRFEIPEQIALIGKG